MQMLIFGYACHVQLVMCQFNVKVSTRGDSCKSARGTSPLYASPVVVVVGRLASTGCQRPNATSLAGSAGHAGLAGLVRVCTLAFSFPSSPCPASHRRRCRPGAQRVEPRRTKYQYLIIQLSSYQHGMLRS